MEKAMSNDQIDDLTLIRDLVVVGESDGNGLIGLYLLTDEQSEAAWEDEDVWAYIASHLPKPGEPTTSGLREFDTYSDLHRAIVDEQLTIREVWVTQPY